MPNSILMRRGLEANLPPLAEGEIGFCTDTHNVYVGTSQGNVLVGEREGNDAQLPAWIGPTKPTYVWGEIGEKPTFAPVATSGNYSDLSNKPTIPAAAEDVGALPASAIQFSTVNLTPGVSSLATGNLYLVYE